MRILITGGAGSIGCNLVRFLLGRGCDVVCMDNFVTGAPENIVALRGRPGFHFVHHDVTSYIVANPSAKSYMTPEQAASQRDIADYGTKVNFWQWSPRRERYQEIWNEVKAGR